MWHELRAYCQQIRFSLIVVALCAMQNSSHLIPSGYINNPSSLFQECLHLISRMPPPAYTAFSVSQICSVPLANFSRITFLGI